MSETLTREPVADPEPMKRVVLTEEQKKKPIWEILQEVLGPVPLEERDKVPHDGAENHDHYLYGSPKRSDG